MSRSNKSDNSIVFTNQVITTPVRNGFSDLEISPINAHGFPEHLKLKTLGMDENLMPWIEITRCNPVLLNSPLLSTKPKLQEDAANLYKILLEINDKLIRAFDNIPTEVLPYLPGYRREIYEKVRCLNQNVKARIRQVDRRILSITNGDSPISISSTEADCLNMMKNMETPCSTMSGNKSFNIAHKKRNLEVEFNNLESNKKLMKSEDSSFIVQNLPSATRTKDEKNNCDSEIKNINFKNVFSNFMKDSSPESYDENLNNQTNTDKLQLYFYKIEDEPEQKLIKNVVNPTSTTTTTTKLENVTSAANMSPAVKLIGNVINDGVTDEFNHLNFPHTKEMLEIFRSVFGLHEFRPNQLAAINAIVCNHDCFVLMPTGGGKSLCYQLPALLSSGLTVVISPLRSLIIDQVQKLELLDIPALYLTSDLTRTKEDRVYHELYTIEKKVRLLYVTPEKISMSGKFWKCLQTLYALDRLSRFVIDEVHCVSQWGHDFRPDYKRLNVLKQRFPKVPLVGLTATATERVREDVLHQLQLRSPRWFISSFNRPNLRYSVIQRRAKSGWEHVMDLVLNNFRDECGIVYCISRKDCDECAKALANKGVSVLSYHAGLEDRVRVERQNQWSLEKVKVICATVAFGMGIDKPNVRFVIHASMPKSIESYYQESGRAGRDGEPADCVLLYNYGDKHRLRSMIQTPEQSGRNEALETHLENLNKITHYCENVADCRRALQLNYFGERFNRTQCIANPETTCDNCRAHDEFYEFDVTEDSKSLVKLIIELNRVRQDNVTILQVVDIYKGCDVSNIAYKLGQNYRQYHGQGRNMTKHEIERLLRSLVVEGYLCENMRPNNGIVCAYVAPGRRAQQLLNDTTIKLLQQKKLPVQRKQTPNTPEISKGVKNIEKACYDELLKLIRDLAETMEVSINSVMNLVALRTMSRRLPRDEAAMLAIPHVTRANYERYGRPLLEITRKYADKKDELTREQVGTKTPVTPRENLEFDDGDDDAEWADFKDRSVERKKSSTRAKPSGSTSTITRPKKNGRKRTKDDSKNQYFEKNEPSSATNESKPNGSRDIKSYFGTSKSSTSTSSNNGPGLCELTKKIPKKS